MSSASSGQPGNYISFKSTPETDMNTLQLDRETSVMSNSSSKLPNSTNNIFLNPSKTGSSQIDGSIAQQEKHDISSSNLNPDDTIQQVNNSVPGIPEKTPDIQAANNEPTKQEFSNPYLDKSPIKMEEAIATLPESGKAEKADMRSTSAQGNPKVSAYARLEFENYIFYVQTLQVVLGRKSENEQSHSVDVHLGSSKAISRKHAKIFYNFGTERFELSIQGKNGAFVDDIFVERSATVPLTNRSKIQIGQIVFRFVLPGANPLEKIESPSKPINPADAISLRSTLYTNHNGNEDAGDVLDSREVTPSLTSKDFEPVNANTSANVGTGSPSLQAAGSTESGNNANANSVIRKPKEKKAPRPPKPPKKVYTLDEIPEEYRTKPNCSYSNLIATCLRTHGTPKGMSLAEIYKSIRDIFPYYKYCPDGWQSSVRHNLSLNKAFRKVSKEGKGWLWGLDEEYCAEKERAKKKQAAAAAAKAKNAQLKMEQQQQQQQLKLQQQKQLQMAQAAQQQMNTPSTGVSTALPSGQLMAANGQIPQQTPLFPIQNIPSSLSQNQLNSINIPLQTNSTVSSPNLGQHQQQFNQFQNQHMQQSTLQQPHVQSQQSIPTQQSIGQQTIQQPKTSQTLQSPPLLQNNLPKPNIAPSQQSVVAAIAAQNKTPSIQAQLAANRGITPQPISARPSPSQSGTPPQGTKQKALMNLQKELVILSKDLRGLVDKPTISAILTQAIAMTIAQVTQAAKTKGITSDPLATLVETNPQQLTKILTVAMNAATYKVTNGRIKAPLSIPSNTNSGPSSRVGTPSPSSTPVANKQQLQPPVVQQRQLQQPQPQKPLIQVQQQSQSSSPVNQVSGQPDVKGVSNAPLLSRSNSQVKTSQGLNTGSPSLQRPSSGLSVTSANPNESTNSSPALQLHQPQPVSVASPALNVAKQGISESALKTVNEPTSGPQRQTSPGSNVPAPTLSLTPAVVSQETTNSSQQVTKDSGPIVDSEKLHPSDNSSSLGMFEDDPEFNKVLESLSKEGTPGLESEQGKVLDDDELNRLLSSDFGAPHETDIVSGNNENNNKRSFEESEISASEEQINKVMKTEQ